MVIGDISPPKSKPSPFHSEPTGRKPKKPNPFDWLPTKLHATECERARDINFWDLGVAAKAGRLPSRSLRCSNRLVPPVSPASTHPPPAAPTSTRKRSLMETTSKAWRLNSAELGTARDLGIVARELEGLDPRHNGCLVPRRQVRVSDLLRTSVPGPSKVP